MQNKVLSAAYHWNKDLGCGIITYYSAMRCNQIRGGTINRHPLLPFSMYWLSWFTSLHFPYVEILRKVIEIARSVSQGLVKTSHV